MIGFCSPQGADVGAPTKGIVRTSRHAIGPVIPRPVHCPVSSLSMGSAPCPPEIRRIRRPCEIWCRATRTNGRRSYWGPSSIATSNSPRMPDCRFGPLPWSRTRPPRSQTVSAAPQPRASAKGSWKRSPCSRSVGRIGLRQSLPTTNAIESPISRTCMKRNVKRQRSGHMVLRWSAAAVLGAVKDFAD